MAISTFDPQGPAQGAPMAMAPLPQSGHEIATASASAQAIAAVQARYALAVGRPRSIDQARADLLQDCHRPAFAEVARYSKPIGGTSVQGPSIRFVEAALRAYKNIMRETYMMYDSPQTRVVRVALTDLENNLTHQTDVSVTKTVERSRVRDGQRVLGQRINSYGKPVYTIEATEDEVRTKEAAAVSKAIRELGLRLLPGDLVDEGQARCMQTLAEGIKSDPAEARKKTVDAFVSIGVQPNDLEKWLGHTIASSSPAQIAELRKVYASIKAGETTWREVIEERDVDADDTDQDAPKGDGKTQASRLADKVRANGKS